MFPLGHLGVTAAFGEFLARRGHYVPYVDFRFLVFGGFLPDLIDKPLAFAFSLGGRTIGHSLIFNVSLSLLLLLWFLHTPGNGPERSARRVVTVLAIGSWTHLILDRIWEQPWAFLWPFLGLGPPEYVPGQYLELPLHLQGPYIILGEVIGFVIVLVMSLRYGLYRKSNLVRAIRTGKLG